MKQAKLAALIVGCGYVGCRLRDLLISKGWLVHSIRRSKLKEPNSRQVDVGQPFSIASTYNVVFYMVSADSYLPEAYNTAYCQGVMNTIAALQASKQKPRLIYVSSTSLFAEKTGDWVFEDSLVETNSFSQKAVAQGEQLARTSGLEHVIIRFSGIYGPNRFRLVDKVRQGNAKLKQPYLISNRIHLEDCAQVLFHVARLENPQKLYIASDSEPTPYNEVLQWIAKQLGKKLLSIDKAESEALRLTNKRCSNRLLRESGYLFRYPNFQKGYAECF
tara:strand:- start:183 stop:1007 length:825 start_codon:yes stop_codon:yes gene_type:complete